MLPTSFRDNAEVAVASLLMLFGDELHRGNQPALAVQQFVFGTAEVRFQLFGEVFRRVRDGINQPVDDNGGQQLRDDVRPASLLRSDPVAQDRMMSLASSAALDLIAVETDFSRMRIVT